MTIKKSIIMTALCLILSASAAMADYTTPGLGGTLSMDQLVS